MIFTLSHRAGLRPDWRERLNRNLARPSTGRWEKIDMIVTYTQTYDALGNFVDEQIVPE